MAVITGQNNVAGAFRARVQQPAVAAPAAQTANQPTAQPASQISPAAAALQENSFNSMRSLSTAQGGINVAMIQNLKQAQIQNGQPKITASKGLSNLAQASVDPKAIQPVDFNKMSQAQQYD